MDWNYQLKNTLTWGAHGRVNKVNNLHEEHIEELAEYQNKIESERDKVENQLEDLIKSKLGAISSLKNIEKIAKNFSICDRDLTEKKFKYQKRFNFAEISETIKLGDVALKSASGAGTGVATASGAWALAGWIGTASTGTSISTLSGVASTNATLAWLGGGSIASGGAGMAGGALVLGGLIGIPILLFWAGGSHISANKQIKHILESDSEVIKAIDESKTFLSLFSGIKQRVEELISTIEKEQDVFLKEFNIIHDQLFSSFFRNLWRRIRKLFGKNYFNDEELQKITIVGECASNLAIIIDTKIFDEDGNLI